MEAGYRCAAFHPDGVILGTGTTDGLVLVWEVKQQKVRRLERNSEAVLMARGRPSCVGSVCLACVHASGDLPYTVLLSQISMTCTRFGLLRAPTPATRSWSADTQLPAVRDGVCGAPQNVAKFEGHKGAITAVSFSENGCAPPHHAA